MQKRTVVDVYSCQGAASRGYKRAGFQVLGGVDIDPQPRYPYPFFQGDAVEFLRRNRDWLRSEVTLIHASPPCQFDSDCQVIQGRDHPDLIGPTREALESVGVPYVLENVPGAVGKLREPVELCGQMFGLTRTYRHRYFETGGWSLSQPDHPEHRMPQTKLGRAPVDGHAIQAIGNFSGVEIIRREWDVPWMNREGIREAIPPAYTEFIGRRFLDQHVDR